MPGVPMELAEHRLEVNKTARPIKQKLRRFAKDRKQAIENVNTQFGSQTWFLYQRKLVD
jgi:hypothetical protein